MNCIQVVQMKTVLHGSEYFFARNIMSQPLFNPTTPHRNNMKEKTITDRIMVYFVKIMFTPIMPIIFLWDLIDDLSPLKSVKRLIKFYKF